MSSYPFDLVLFDLDGTLIETAPEIADACNDTLQASGFPAASLEAVTNWIGHGTRELLIQAFASAMKTTAEAVRSSEGFPALEQAFGRHYLQRCGTRSTLYPQVRETLEALRAQGVKLAVVTNKEERYTRVVIDAHHLRSVLDVVISGDSLPVKKPDPLAIQQCIERFGTSAERTIFIGDSSIDIETARRAGVAVWALPYGYNMGKPIEEAGADRVIENVSALLPANVVSAESPSSRGDISI